MPPRASSSHPKWPRRDFLRGTPIDAMTPPFPFTAEQLLEHGRSLRALARGVLADESAAEDVVQDAWIMALERPPAERERIGGWLHTVVRTLALKRMRGERRRSRREEEAARPERTASAVESIEVAALCKRLVDAVVELEEPYRVAVSMRYFEDLPPREIARRLGVPVNTVRSRLQRGLAQLRHRFEGDSEGGREAWAPALLAVAGLTNVRTAVPAATATLGSTLGVATMVGIGKWVAGGLAIVVVGLGLMELAKDPGVVPGLPTEGTAKVDPVALRGVRATEGDRRTEVVPSEIIDTDGLAMPAPPPWAAARRYPFEVVGRVVDRWGRPAGYVGVYVGVAEQRLNRAPSPDADGRFVVRFQAATPRVDMHLVVRSGDAMASGMRTLHLVSGEETLVHVDLVDWGDHPAGAPRPDRLAVLDEAPGMHGDPDAPVRFHSDCGVDVGISEELLIDEEISDANETFEAGPPSRDRVSFVGVVRAADGSPAHRTVVGVQRDGLGYGSWVFTNDEGEWRIEGLDPGTYSLHAGGGDYGLASAERTVGAGGREVWSPWLDRGREVRGRLLGPDGEPLPFLVCAEAPGPRAEWSHSTRADADGRFAIPNAPPGPLRLLFFPPQHRPFGVPWHVEETSFADGIERDLVLPHAAVRPATLFVSLVDEEGAPITRPELRLHHPASGRGMLLSPSPTTEDPARHTAFDLPAGTYRLEAGSPHRGWLDLGVFALLPDQTLDLGRFTFPAPGLLVASCDPRAMEKSYNWNIVQVGERVDSIAWEGWALDFSTWNDEEPPGWAKVALPPGDYAFATGGEDTGRAWFPFAIDSSGVTELELPLLLLAEVTLRLQRGALASAAVSLGVQVRDAASGAPILRTELAAGANTWTLKLLPGSYRVEVMAATEPLGEALFEVQAATGMFVPLPLR